MNSEIRTCRTLLGFGLLCAGPLLLATACDRSARSPTGENRHAAEDRAEDHAGEEGHADGVVRLAPSALEEFGIELAVAGPGSIEKTISLPAEVRPNQDRLAHIAPRFPGIAREVRSRIGDRVKPGQVLAVIESEALAPFDLKTQIHGVVIAKHITRGEPVSREQAAFVVADLRDVWIDISVYQKDLALLRVGQPVVVSAGHDLEEARGEISYLAPVVDEATRTATARLVLPNPQGAWRPGLFVTARVEVAREEVPLVVPESALEAVDERTVVFVQVADGFEARAVSLGRRGDRHVEILSGLAPGARYVARGGFTLKAELQSGEFSGGHAH
jgi:cobalt-zinc-cadmium efflux system membrane fusion protein